MPEHETFAVIPGIGGSKEDFEPLIDLLATDGISVDFLQPPFIQTGNRKQNLERIAARDAEFTDLLAERIIGGDIHGVIAHSRSCYLALLTLQKSTFTHPIPVSLICPPAIRRRVDASLLESNRSVENNVLEDLGPRHALYPEATQRLMSRWDESGNAPNRDAIFAEIMGLSRQDPEWLKKMILSTNWRIQIFANKLDRWYEEPPKTSNVTVEEIKNSSHFPHITHTPEVAQLLIQFARSLKDQSGLRMNVDQDLQEVEV